MGVHHVAVEGTEQIADEADMQGCDSRSLGAPSTVFEQFFPLRSN